MLLFSTAAQSAFVRIGIKYLTLLCLDLLGGLILGLITLGFFIFVFIPYILPWIKKWPFRTQIIVSNTLPLVLLGLLMACYAIGNVPLFVLTSTHFDRSQFSVEGLSVQYPKRWEAMAKMKCPEDRWTPYQVDAMFAVTGTMRNLYINPLQFSQEGLLGWEQQQLSW
jgi:hypothetical protein